MIYSLRPLSRVVRHKNVLESHLNYVSVQIFGVRILYVCTISTTTSPFPNFISGRLSTEVVRCQFPGFSALGRRRGNSYFLPVYKVQSLDPYTRLLILINPRPNSPMKPYPSYIYDRRYTLHPFVRPP